MKVTKIHKIKPKMDYQIFEKNTFLSTLLSKHFIKNTFREHFFGNRFFGNQFLVRFFWHI